MHDEDGRDPGALPVSRWRDLPRSIALDFAAASSLGTTARMCMQCGNATLTDTSPDCALCAEDEPTPRRRSRPR